MQTIEIAGRSTPPEWALRQRRLMAEMDRAAPRFVAKYTRDDGTFIWRDEWPGMDGSDDAVAPGGGGCGRSTSAMAPGC